ncbi:hypothetical protein FA15DRAFT_656786 [Coprinopsis marcescibilis]|uniref:Uncharacterized protein n=1 Tax=Coprinopsis marcescibilis TaxID=230819 RepID=A0A5C3KSD1_COPMA|nr:hypothetical protein FA15DRAFT_656786 [Coprinopsis marcescibilis]
MQRVASYFRGPYRGQAVDGGIELPLYTRQPPSEGGPPLTLLHKRSSVPASRDAGQIDPLRVDPPLHQQPQLPPPTQYPPRSYEESPQYTELIPRPMRNLQANGSNNSIISRRCSRSPPTIQEVDPRTQQRTKIRLVENDPAKQRQMVEELKAQMGALNEQWIKVITGSQQLAQALEALAEAQQLAKANKERAEAAEANALNIKRAAETELLKAAAKKKEDKEKLRSEFEGREAALKQEMAAKEAKTKENLEKELAARDARWKEDMDEIRALMEQSASIGQPKATQQESMEGVEGHDATLVGGARDGDNVEVVKEQNKDTGKGNAASGKTSPKGMGKAVVEEDGDDDGDDVDDVLCAPVRNASLRNPRTPRQTNSKRAKSRKLDALIRKEFLSTGYCDEDDEDELVSPPVKPRRSRAGNGPQVRLASVETDEESESSSAGERQAGQSSSPRSNLQNALTPDEGAVLKKILQSLFDGQQPSPSPNSRKKRLNIGNFQSDIAWLPMDPERKELLRETRATFNTMLGIKKDIDIVTHDARFEDEVAVDAFEKQMTDVVPTLVPLRPSWSSPNSRWNEALSNSFAAWMMEHRIIPKEWKDDAALDFLARVSRLAGILRKNSPWDKETPAAFNKRQAECKARGERRAKKNTRRANRYYRRKEITEEARGVKEEDEAWAKIDEVVAGLGLAGMSSDESEYDDNGVPTGKTLVCTMPWRSNEVTNILKMVDSDGMRMETVGVPRPGNRGLIRKRVRGLVSSRTAKKGLPLNYYNPDWYQGLSNELKRSLEAMPTRPLPNLEIISDD